MSVKPCAVDGCNSAGHQGVMSGLCQKHYNRLKRRGTTDDQVRTVRSAIDRYLPKVAPPDENGCQIWLGAIDKRGYGRFQVGTWRNKHTVFAHRFAYETFVGPLTASDVVMHTCDNPPCQTPSHLRSGSHADNVADKVSKDRHDRGERHAAAVLTESQVRTIRERHAKGATLGELRDEYGTSVDNIRHIVKRRSWRGI